MGDGHIPGFGGMILVTGCPRSGTSLTARILQDHGVHLGAVNDLYEHQVIRQEILKPFLKSIGADSLGQRKLPPLDMTHRRPSLGHDVLSRLGGVEPRGYKDAKLCLVWQAWADAFPEAKWIIVRRDTDEIVDSCLRTKFMKAHGNDRKAWRSWVREHEKRFSMMRDALDTIEVWPREFMDDAEAFRPVAAFCGRAFDANAVKAAIDGKRFRFNA